MIGVRPLGIATLAVFFLAAFTPLPVRLYDLLAVPARIGPADAIVVLAGGGVLSGGELSDTSRRRTALGIDLYRDGLAPLLVLSGAVGWRSESTARAALAGKCGVPDAAVPGYAWPAGYGWGYYPFGYYAWGNYLYANYGYPYYWAYPPIYAGATGLYYGVAGYR